MDERAHHYGWNVLHWEENKLYFQDQWLVEIVPSKYEKQYHLQFYWRDEPTVEFFNVFNARENARRFALHRLNYNTWQRGLGAPYSDLNKKEVECTI